MVWVLLSCDNIQVDCVLLIRLKGFINTQQLQLSHAFSLPGMLFILLFCLEFCAKYFLIINILKKIKE